MMQQDTYTDLELKLRAECERGFEVGPKTPGALETPTPSFGPLPSPWIAPTGEPFVELINRKDLLANDDECYVVALTVFRDYANGRSGTLYWRTYPEIERGKFYMRLLISDKPAGTTS